MGEETARLRREIDRTREDLTRDVDMIADKTSPSRIVERRVERTRRGLAGLKEKVMGEHDQDSAGGRGSSDPYGAGYYGATYEGGAQSSREGVGGVTTTITDRARGAMSSAQGAVDGVGDRASELSERASGAAHDGVSTARRQTEGNPLAAGLVAFGIGWLVSSLMPASDAETQAARRATEKVGENGGGIVEQAKQAAAEVGENLKGSAAEAVEQVKGHAREAAQTVKDEGASAARTVKDEGASAAQTVKDEGTSAAQSGGSGPTTAGSTVAGSAAGTSGTSGPGTTGTSLTSGPDGGRTY
ncbi:MAG: DUF3618 domain-containing protein [Kineosporiaceae bacterium]